MQNIYIQKKFKVKKFNLLNFLRYICHISQGNIITKKVYLRKIRLHETSASLRDGSGNSRAERAHR